jgi:thiamine biosynthesis protein ThiS
VFSGATDALWISVLLLDRTVTQSRNRGALLGDREAQALMQISITLNGQPRQVAADQTVGDLLAELNLQPKYLAVELNEQVLPRSQFGSVRLQCEDRVEIVTLVGGG